MGSLTDAEDVLQETLLAARRGLDGFEGRASLRFWLTNRRLNVLRDRGRRILPEPQPPFHADGHHPINHGPAVTDPDIGSWFITFPLRNRHEQQARHPIRSRPDLELVRGVTHDNPSQGVGPPSTKRDRIVSVDDDLLPNETASHTLPGRSRERTVVRAGPTLIAR
jgi:DNA-directed RNA polymerase specialized sigma24 family protein